MRKFNRSLPMTLMKAREVVLKEFIPHLREHNLSTQQWRVLRALVEDESMDATTIAQRCGIMMPSLSRILQNLEGRQLLKRETSKLDLRRSVVTITEDGRELFEHMAPLQEQRYAKITERFGYGKLELLYELLDELIAKVDNAPEQKD